MQKQNSRLSWSAALGQAGYVRTSAEHLRKIVCAQVGYTTQGLTDNLHSKIAMQFEV